MSESKILVMLHSDGYLDAENYIRSLETRLAQSEGNRVVEYCANCGSEIEMRWNVETDGYKAFCPFCGKRLMLCDECRHSGSNRELLDGICDYDSATDTCRRNRKENNI